MNIFKKAYGKKQVVYYSELDADTLKSYMLRFCDVSSRTLSNVFWADMLEDGSFDFQIAFSFNRAKHIWINARVLPTANGCLIDVDVKFKSLNLIIINVAVIVIGLFFLWMGIDRGSFEMSLIFITLFFLLVMPVILALSNINQRRYLLKRFIGEFDLTPQSE